MLGKRSSVSIRTKLKYHERETGLCQLECWVVVRRLFKEETAIRIIEDLHSVARRSSRDILPTCRTRICQNTSPLNQDISVLGGNWGWYEVRRKKYWGEREARKRDAKSIGRQHPIPRQDEWEEETDPKVMSVCDVESDTKLTSFAYKLDHDERTQSDHKSNISHRETKEEREEALVAGDTLRTSLFFYVFFCSRVTSIRKVIKRLPAPSSAWVEHLLASVHFVLSEGEIGKKGQHTSQVSRPFYGTISFHSQQ